MRVQKSLSMTSSVSATPYSPYLPVETAARTNFTRDIVSWTLDVRDYDEHKPVSTCSSIASGKTLFIWTTNSI